LVIGHSRVTSMHADDDDAEADLDASRKSHLFKIKLVAPRNSIETVARREEQQEETLFEIETNQNLFVHRKKTFLSFSSEERQVLDHEKNVIGNHTSRHS
jgi:hypothetical protein